MPLAATPSASQYGNNAYIAPQASLTDGMMDITILEPFTVLDVPSLSFQLFNKTINQNSRIKTVREKKIIIHRTKEGVFHFDGDPVMGGKDLEVEIIHGGLRAVVPDEQECASEPSNFLTHFAELISKKQITNALIDRRKQILTLNQQIRRKLSR